MVDPFAQRRFRLSWEIVDQLTAEVPEGPEPLEGKLYRSWREIFSFPPMLKQYVIQAGDEPHSYNHQPGKCIYCGAVEYDKGFDRRLGDEHIIPEGLNGSLELKEASCKICEIAINSKEQSILRGVMWASRHNIGMRLKRRKRAEKIPCFAEVDGREVTLSLSCREHPSFIILPIFNPPGLLSDRPSSSTGLKGVWAKSINYNSKSLRRDGLVKGNTGAFDMLHFRQMLAKIATGFVAAEIGVDRSRFLLTDFLLKNFSYEENELSSYRLIGGLSELEEPSENLHEIGWTPFGHGSNLYIFVRLRLFASLGAPTFYVLPGFVADSHLFRSLTRHVS